jgi:hypothetical protein
MISCFVQTSFIWLNCLGLLRLLVVLLLSVACFIERMLLMLLLLGTRRLIELHGSGQTKFSFLSYEWF